MNKSNFFTGQPILAQLLNFLNKRDIESIVRERKGDRYVKKFTTWSHLVTMLYNVYQHCTSIREVTTGLLACEGRLQNLGVHHFVKKSTLADANSRRSSEVFEQIFNKTYQRLRPFLPDSRLRGSVFKKLYIIDSTSISLFQEIMKAAGREPSNGKRKGGVKVHLSVKATEDVPNLVMITAAARNDAVFLDKINCPRGSYIVFDKGYNSFKQFNIWHQQGLYWVTRLRYNTIVTVEKKNPVNDVEKAAGIMKDETVVIGHTSNQIQKVHCRLITYYDAVNKRVFKFLTNNNRIKASTVAAIYKQRWQIEILFKRLKQTLQLQHFLGDNENAIRIQIWCTLIADLLLKVATANIKKSWAFTNLAAFVRLHLMNYTDLKKFLNDPEKARIINPSVLLNSQQLKLFSSA
ncbi:MAG TPA: IS4 family transposase [Puia sp.]|nr:IS4 family transposase [Puia sp.]